MVSKNKRKDHYKGCRGSLTKLEFQEALSKRLLQARVLHERKLSLNRADNLYNTKKICREQAKLRKQLLRLENVKRKNKENSYLNEEMRLLIQNELSSVGNEKFQESITLLNTLEVPNPKYTTEITFNNRQVLTPIIEVPSQPNSRAGSPSPSVGQTRGVEPVNSLPHADAVAKSRALTPSTELTQTRAVTLVHNLTPLHGLELTRAVKERHAITRARDIIPTRDIPKHALQTTQTLSPSIALIPSIEVTPADELSRALTPKNELFLKRADTPTRALTPVRSVTSTRELTLTGDAVTPARALTPSCALTPIRSPIPSLALISTEDITTPARALTPSRALTPIRSVTSAPGMTLNEDAVTPARVLTPSRVLLPIRSVTPTRELTISEDAVTPARVLTPSRALTPIRSVTPSPALMSTDDSITSARDLIPAHVSTPLRSVTPIRALTPFSDITQALACTLDVSPNPNDGLVSRSLRDKEENTATELEKPLDSEKSKKPSRSPRASPRRCSIKQPRRESIILSCPNIRRGSLPATLYLPGKPVLQFRRLSSPVNSLMIPEIQVETVEDEADDNQTKLNQLYTKAIETIQRVDMRQMKEKTGRAGQSSSPDIDLESLRKLQAILTNEKTYSDRFGQKDDPRRLEMSQKKKIDELESILKKLDPDSGNTFRIDPVKELECTYLRLTKSNVENLENMIREQGKDPGIHTYTDVTQCDIWSGLREECSEKDR